MIIALSPILTLTTSFSFTSTRASMWLEIGHAHHLGAGKLIGRDDALAELAVQHGDGAVDRRVDGRLGKLVARLARAGLGALDLVQRAFVGRLRDIAARFARR